MKKLSVLIIALFLTNVLFATNYYLSNNGSDANTGNSPLKPWKTIEKLNSQKLLPSDSILFNRGNIFIGEIKIKSSGTQKSSIVFDAFGKGFEPVITGAIDINKWQKHNESIIKTTVDKNVKMLYCNNKLQIIARYPNQENGRDKFLTIKKGNGKGTGFSSDDLTQTDGYYDGATVRYRLVDWEFGYRKVKTYTKGSFVFENRIRNTYHDFEKGFGFLIDNKYELLDAKSEWYNDSVSHSLYFISPDNIQIEKATVQAVVCFNAIELESNVSNIVIRNLRFEKYFGNGIWGKANNNNIVVDKCNFQFIDKCGIKLEMFSKYSKIENCNFTDIYGAGINTFEPENILIENNKLIRIGMKRFYGLDGVNGLTGIVIQNIEEVKKKDSHIAAYNKIRYNYLDTVGHMIIRMDGKKSVCEYNILKNGNYWLQDGGSLYCWADSNELYTYDNVLNHNIIINAYGCPEATSSKEVNIAQGIYLDNYSSHILVENNTVVNAISGFLINCAANNNIMRNNTAFACRNEGFAVVEWGKKSGLTINNQITNNISVCTSPKAKAIFIGSHLVADFNPGIIDSNIYVNPYEMFYLQKMNVYGHVDENGFCKMGNTKKDEYNNLKGWQETTGWDMHSTGLGPHNPIIKHREPKIFINEERVDKQFDLSDGEYFDLKGNKVETPIKIKPFESMVLLKKDNQD